MTELDLHFIVLRNRAHKRVFSALPEEILMDLLKKFWLLWTSLLAVVIGFVTLSAGMLTVGPVLLVVGYCVLLPFFLWRSFQDSVGE